MSPRMPDNHRSPSAVTMAFLGRSVLSLRRSQVVSMDQYHEEELQDLDLFQSYVADRLLSLLSPQKEKLPPPSADHDDHVYSSFSFLQRLLDVFVSCEDEFKNLLSRNPGLFAKPPADRLLADLLDRSVKSLDICKAVRQNLQSLRHWNRNAVIAASAIPTRAESPAPPISEGHLRRTRKALANLLAGSSEANSPIPSASSRKPERAWSFRSKAAASAREESLQQSYSKSWSGLKQVQAMSASLAVPRVGEAGSSGFAVAVYTMSSVLVFAMWALVAAFPCCQERSTSVVSTAPAVVVAAPPKQLVWSGAMHSLQERISEELRRRGRREGGILMEFLRVEKCGKELKELVGAAGGGTEEEEEEEATVAKATELAKASGRLEEGLGPFERKVREVFHRVVDSRGEVMKLLEQTTTSAPPFILL